MYITPNEAIVLRMMCHYGVLFFYPNAAIVLRMMCHYGILFIQMRPSFKDDVSLWNFIYPNAAIV